MNGLVLRPLLAWRHAELADIVRSAGIAAVEDPSNADVRFDRVRVRRGLAEASWLDPSALARSALALGEAEDALEWAAGRLLAERSDEAGRLDPAGLPAELRRRLLLAMLRRINPAAEPRGDELGRLLATLDSGGTGTLAGVRCVGRGGAWRFERAAPRRSG